MASVKVSSRYLGEFSTQLTIRTSGGSAGQGENLLTNDGTIITAINVRLFGWEAGFSKQAGAADTSLWVLQGTAIH